MDSNNLAKSSIGAVRSSLPLPPKTLIGFLLAVAAVAIIALLSDQSLQATTDSTANLTQTIEVLGHLEGLLSTLKDAETGQRGFLLTGDESYLTPYTDAKDSLPDELSSMRALLVNRPEQRRRLDGIESLANLKMAEMEATVVERRAGKPDAALATVRTDRGKIYMDRIRAAVSEMDGRAAVDRAACSRIAQCRDGIAGGDLGRIGAIGVLDCRRRRCRVPGFPGSPGPGLDQVRSNGLERANARGPAAR